MSLDATVVDLTITGEVRMYRDGTIYLSGFKGTEGCSCRDVATLALVWAIGRLQKELLANIMQPGGTGNVGID